MFDKVYSRFLLLITALIKLELLLFETKLFAILNAIDFSSWKLVCVMFLIDSGIKKTMSIWSILPTFPQSFLGYILRYVLLFVISVLSFLLRYVLLSVRHCSTYSPALSCSSSYSHGYAKFSPYLSNLLSSCFLVAQS